MASAPMPITSFAQRHRRHRPRRRRLDPTMPPITGDVDGCFEMMGFSAPLAFTASSLPVLTAASRRRRRFIFFFILRFIGGAARFAITRSVATPLEAAAHFRGSLSHFLSARR